MLKVKYLRLDKIKQKEVRIKYSQTKKGSALLKQLRNLIIISIFIIVFGAVIIIDGILNTKSIIDYIYGAFVCAIGIIFLIIIHKIKIKKYNDYVINTSI